MHRYALRGERRVRDERGGYPDVVAVWRGQDGGGRVRAATRGRPPRSYGCRYGC